MKSTLTILIALMTGLFLTTCSHRLAGTWKVKKYETSIAGQQIVALMDVGSMTFYDDGTGEKDIEYTILGIIKKDTMSFHWVATEKQVTIQSENSEFGKTWIIIDNGRNFQKWKSTDGIDQVQILELAK
jgi:hypothetical protein